VSGDLDAIADRLEAIAEELADLAIDRLKAAVVDGERVRPADEKRITQARRAVDKAVHVLRGAAGADD
jgi:transketolase C-terminal domain/subunit